MQIKLLQENDRQVWDAYVHEHPKGGLYHLSGWRNAIEEAYDHKTYYLMATHTTHPERNAKQNSAAHAAAPQIIGILPLVHIKSLLFGNSLVSLPFFDFAGILADTGEVEQALLGEALAIGRRIGAAHIEVRHTQPLSWFDDQSPTTAVHSTRVHKVRMTLPLPSTSEALMTSFKSKLRSQIKKPLKGGLQSVMGGAELLDDFYGVFAVNMRDLGSPVHSRRLIQNVLSEFAHGSTVHCVYKGKKPIAGSIVIGFKDTLENPWASSLKEYSRYSPNMLLYWSMLEYGCNYGYSLFDFGRSTPHEGTYNFKRQWGAKPELLHWHYASLAGKNFDTQSTQKDNFNRFIQLWKKLPVSATRLVGPVVRKHIPA